MGADDDVVRVRGSRREPLCEALRLGGSRTLEEEVERDGAVARWAAMRSSARRSRSAVLTGAALPKGDGLVDDGVGGVESFEGEVVERGASSSLRRPPPPPREGEPGVELEAVRGPVRSLHQRGKRGRTGVGERRRSARSAPLVLGVGLARLDQRRGTALAVATRSAEAAGPRSTEATAARGALGALGRLEQAASRRVPVDVALRLDLARRTAKAGAALRRRATEASRTTLHRRERTGPSPVAHRPSLVAAVIIEHAGAAAAAVSVAKAASARLGRGGDADSDRSTAEVGAAELHGAFEALELDELDVGEPLGLVLLEVHDDAHRDDLDNLNELVLVAIRKD